MSQPVDLELPADDPLEPDLYCLALLQATWVLCTWQNMCSTNS